MERQTTFFPSGQDRKQELAQNEKVRSDFKRDGKDLIDKGRYSWLDSGLDHASHGIGEACFHDSFGRLLPESVKSLKLYIEGVLSERKGQAIGIEYGGVGINLFAGFDKDFFARSIGVTLVDHRSEDAKVVDGAKLDKMHHSVIAGDIFDRGIYQHIDELLQGEKADLIIERMAKGLEFVPHDPYIVGKIINTWYRMLREGGVMFVQTPMVFNHLLERWASLIKSEQNLEFEYQIGREDNNIYCSAFRLNKLSGAPDELPLLEPRDSKSIPKREP